MKTEQGLWEKGDGWKINSIGSSDVGDSAELVIIFSARNILEDKELHSAIKSLYPNALLFGCSTAGEIIDTYVYNDTTVTTAIKFNSCKLKSCTTYLSDVNKSEEVGEKLGKELASPDLKHVIVLSQGTNVNGSKLAKGITQSLPCGVTVTGGLSADGTAFGKTLVICADEIGDNLVAALGIYGESLEVGYASVGGWSPFGPERKITHSRGNVLYMLDNRPALDLYKEYLGDQASDLPSSGLLFPLAVRPSDADTSEAVVRTILSVCEKEHSITVAGDIPEGWSAQLMVAQPNDLIEAASEAAKISMGPHAQHQPELSLLISCVGRKLFLKQRTEEEVESVRDVFGTNTTITGFYSYGELSPFAPDRTCKLHNQTMTITTLRERD